MRKTLLLGVSSAAIAVAAVVGVMRLFDGPQDAVDADATQATSSSAIPEPVVSTTVRVDEHPDGRGAESASGEVLDAQTAASNDVQVAEVDEEKLLNEVMTDLFKMLGDAIKSGDHKRIAEVLAKFKAIKYGAGLGVSSVGRGRSAAVKRQIIDALGQCGPEAAGDIVEFLGDPDFGVAQQAQNAMFEILKDPTLGDATRADIVTAASEELMDEITLTRLYQEFIRMRHSVGVDAMVQIAASGTDAAKKILPRTMGAFTSNPDITTTEQLKGWLEENPGNADYDEIFYGEKDPINVKTE